MFRLLSKVPMLEASPITSAVYSAFIAVVSVLIVQASSVALVLTILLILMVCDFITGVYSSLYKKRIGVQSHKTQWSFTKYILYSGAIIVTLLLGILLHSLYCLLNAYALSEPSYILQFTMKLVTAVMFLIMWNEAVSVLENILIVHPASKVFRVLHAFVAFDLIKKIPFFNLSKYYKIEKDENKNYVERIDDKKETE